MKGICHVSAGKLVLTDKLTSTNPALAGKIDSFTKAIEDVCGDNAILKIRIITHIQRSLDGADNVFLNWLNTDSGLVTETKTSENLLSGNTKAGVLNINTFKSWVTRFKVHLDDTVAATATKSYVDDLQNYSSERAHKEANEYFGRGIISAYLDRHSVNSGVEESLLNTMIYNNVAQDIIRQVVGIANEFASDLNLDETTQKAISLIDIRINSHKTNYQVNRKKIVDDIVELDKQIAAAESNISSIQNILLTNIPSNIKFTYKTKLEDSKITLDDLNHIKDKKLKELNDLLFDTYSKIYNSYKNIVSNIYDSIPKNSKFYKLKNQAALALNIIEHPSEVKDEVFHLSIMQGIKNVFNPVDESDKIGLPDPTDEMMDNLDADDNADSYDKGTQAWEDKLATDYKKFFGGNLFVYFNSIPRLNSNQKVGEDYDYSSDTELGTPSYYSAVEIINTLTARCSTLSVETFINGIEKLSEQNGYEGFIKIADDMRKSKVFANAITSRFALNTARKDMINIDATGTHLRQSNLRAFPHSQIFLALSNNARNAYTVAYDNNDSIGIKDINTRASELIKQLDNARNKNLDTKELDLKVATLANDASKFIRSYFNKYFPDIDSAKIVKHLYASRTNKLDFIARLFDALEKYNTAIAGVYERAIDERERVNKINKNIRKYDEFGERDYAAERKLHQYPSENKINFNATTPSLKALTDIFYDILEANIELNSRTAKDNMSSDVIKNSYLTNFFKMLDDVVEESVTDTSTGETVNHITYRGAEILKEFLTRKGTNFAYGDNAFSTIIFGVKDLNGKIIKPGLFTQDAKGNITITDDNIKVIKGIKYALFSGVKNQIINNGEEYDSMSARDYFVSTILAFTHPIDYNHDLGTTSDKSTSTLGIGNFANFMMRIPSDASNNYVIQMPKLDTNGRYNFDYSNEQSIISRYTNSFFPINNDLVQNRIVPFYRDVSDYNNSTKHFPNKFEKFTDLLDFIDKVTGANINTTSEYRISNDTLLRRYELNPESAGNKQLYDNIIAQNPDMNGKTMILMPFVYSNNGKDIVLWALGYFDGNSVVVKNIQGIGTLNSKGTSKQAFENFAKEYKANETSVAEYLYQEPHIERHQRTYNLYNPIVCGFRQQLQDSVAKMVNGIQSLLYLDSDGKYKIKKDTNGLFNNYHYTKGSTTKKVDNHLELSGNIFNSLKLFDVNDYSAISNFKSALSLYGEAQDNPIFATVGDELVLNQESNTLFTLENIDGNIRLTPNFDALQDILSSITNDWLNEYDSYIPTESKKYSNTLSQAGIRLDEQPRVVADAILNQTIINMEFDDLFEGSSAFYKDAQTFLKRAKEVQANGYLYMGAVDFTKNYDTSFNIEEDIKLIGEPDNFKEHKPIIIKNSFKAVTINNTYTVYDRANELRQALFDELTRQQIANAAELADQIAAGYGYAGGNVEGAKTCANDAQSYITLDEFIRRKWADGTISDYGDLLYKLKYNIQLTPTEIKQVTQKIQAQKNVYYDRAFDENTNVYYSRFIKNAEIVLIPQFLPEGSGLRALYDSMMELGIDQVNTGETSKASNKNFATFFDENGATNDDGTIKFYTDRFKAEAPALVDTYFYRNLFKQQDVVDHIEDTENKAGIQIMKKIMDNAVSETEFDSEKVKEAKKIIQDNFSVNIKNDFNRLLAKCNWIVDKDGKIVNKDKNKRDVAINISYFRKRFIEEAERLGLDPDFLNYLKVDETTGSFVVPTWLNSSADKMESIAQAIFNRNITRQTLPGFHAVQGSSVGASSKLHYYKEKDGGLVAECKVPMWDSNIKTRYKELLARKGEDNEQNRKLAKQELIAELNKKGLDRFIGYRIPTEGKQSLVVFKVVDFLDDNLGSTMIVPHEWVAQTGSDFDIDTIYAITYPTTKRKNNAVNKFSTNVSENLYSRYFKDEIKKYGRTLEEGTDEKLTFDAVYQEYLNKPIKDITDSDYANYISRLNPESGIMTPNQFKDIPDIEKLTKEQRNTNIIDAFMTIMSDAHSLEENASRSNFDGLLKGKNDNEKLLDETSAKRSTYNPFDQVRFMQNAIDGRKLKAFSVTRDTLNSINNVLRTRLGEDHTIKVRYNLSQYNIDTIQQAYKNVEIYDANDNRIYSIDDIKNEINSIKETAISNGTFMKAPNGKPTNLNEKQWLQVRTKAFKDWFGDWENNPSDSSKIVDENGEPLVVYHSSPSEFNSFSAEYSKDVESGMFFSTDKEYSKQFGQKSYPSFLNLRTPINTDIPLIHGDIYKILSSYKGDINKVDGIIGHDLISDTLTPSKGYEIMVYHPNQIKSAVNNFGLFSKNNKNIYDSLYAIVTHDRIGNSINNRNVLGELLTPYSSQTTAHILDAIKEGALYNETDFTFKVFKTLVDVGIDYDTAIAFLMQPAITRINEDYEQSNSIFNHSWASPINNTIVDLVNELGYDIEVTRYTNTSDLIKALKDTTFFEDFKTVWKTDISPLKGEDNDFNLSNLVLDKEACKDRLRNSKSNTKENLLHDLGIALLYKKYSNTSQNIEDIARCVKPDSFGAKQTVHSTKTVLVNIANFMNKEDRHSSTLVTEDGNSILEAIYPNFEVDKNGHITFDEEKSAYKYLAYFLKYSTIPSVNVNSQIFDTEGPAFANYTSIFEGLLGRPLTDEEYKEFKKYIVSRLYYHDRILTRPVTIDETGKLVEDNQTLFNTDGSIKSSDEEIERKEIRRIFGYDEAQDSDTFTVKNKENPTEEELITYKTLTPLQKVNLIKRLWPDGAGIFNSITTNKVYANEIRKQGYSKNVIRINTYKKEMSIYYNEFIEAISNRNPLIKLAAVDLVKYAYLVEGGRYRNNSITKVIPYEVLEAESNGFGMNLLYDFKDIFGEVINGKNTIEEFDDLLDAFIRSHPNILKNVWLPAPDGQGNIGDQFNECEEKIKGVGIGLIGIPNEDSYSELIHAVTRGNNSKYRYIRINHRNTEKGPVINTLYKMVPHYISGDIDGGADNIDKYYLIPLPLLDVAEGYEVSQNEKYNNGYYDKEFYRDYVKDKYPNHDDIDLNLFKLITEKQTFSDNESVNSLQDSFDGRNDATGNQQTIAKMFVDRMVSLVQKRESITDSKEKDLPLNKIVYIYTKNANASDLAKVFGRTKFARNTQQIVIGGRTYSFDITRVDNRTIKDINKATTTLDGRAKSIGLVKDVADTIPYGTEVDAFQVYAARLIPSQDIAADISNQSEDGSEEDFSIFKGIYTDFELTKEAGTNIEGNELANHIAKEIERSSNNPNNLIAVAAKRKFYSKDIDTNSLDNIIKNQKDVYEIGLEYYRGVAKNLLTQLDAFQLELYPDVMKEGENFFSVDDPKLYDILQKHPEASRRLYTLIVQCKYFGQNIKPILDNIATENDTIKELMDLINKVTNNTKVNAAVKFIFNKYIAKEYSTNPMIKARVVDLLDSFGDIDWFDNTFADILHTNNKLIQVVVKLASEVEAKAEFDAKDRLKEFDVFLKDLELKLGGETVQQALDKIIKNGKFVREFKQDWLDTKENLQKATDEALEKYGKYSKEYLTAKLDRDIWYAENVEQIGAEDYYISKNNITKQLLSDANFPLYKDYLELQDKLNNQYGRIADLSDAQLLEREDILNKISSLRSTHPEFNKLILDLKDLDAIYTVNTGTALYNANKTHMEDICRRIEEAHPEKDIFQLMADYPEYKKAYDWLKYNSPLKYGKRVTTTVAKWRSILANAGEKTEAAIAYNKYLENLKTKYKDFTDRYGNIDASKISSEELAELKRLLYERDNVNPDPDLIANSLIKVGQPDRILKREYYDRSGEEKTLTDIDKKHRELYTKINNLLQKGIDKDLNGTIHINSKKLADNLSVEDLTRLANLYFELREFNKGLHQFDDESQEESNSKTKGAKLPKPQYSMEEYGANIKQAEEITDTEKRKLVKQILTHSYTTKKGKKGTNPNFYIYGYMSVDESMIDNEKTLAKIELRNNIRYVVTDYYKQAEANAKELDKTNPGAYNKWLAENHYYNPREHRYVPLEIWTTMEVLPTSEIFTEEEKKKVEVPNYYDTDKTFKSGDRYTNPKYIEGTLNYKSTAKYDNPEYKALNDAEIELYKRLTWYSNYYAHNYRQRKFNKDGFAPRDFKEITDFKWYEKQFLGFWGIAERNYTSEAEMKKLEYVDEFFTPYDMFNILKTKDSLKEDELPRREDFDDEETYKKRLAEVEESNRKIREKNLEIDNSVLNKDWIQVYKLLIERGEIANAKYDMKDLLFLTLNTLKNTYVPRVDHGKNILGVLSRDKINSTVDNTVNNTEPQVRAAQIFQSWMQKYLYGRFKTEHKMKTLADNLQAFTSAKYMMANIRGGIANINTGLVNIVGEQLAGDAFNTKDFISAATEYGVASVGLIADFFNTDGKASNEVSAICKLFDIVDLDEMMGAPSSSKDLDVTQVSEKVNSLLYGFMGGGEHFMQNSALLAMLNSHKIYTDPETGKQTIGTFEDFTQGIEIASFIDVITNSDFITKHPEVENLLDDFNTYRRHIAARNKNQEEKHKFETLRRNIVTEFIRSHYVPRELKVELSKLYANKVKTTKKEAAIKFNGFESVRSQLEFDRTTGTEVIKKGSSLTNKDLAELKVKAIYTNKKIHGVYDKMGAAQIEQKYWWGSLVMQYHKHLYPGYLKRWRVKGYYNEVTHTYEKGSRISLIDLIAAPFKGNIDFDANGNPTTHFNTERDSEEKTGLRSIVALFSRLSDLGLEYALYWNTMPEWEKRNLMRNLGDLSGIVAGLLFTMILYALFSKQDMKNSRFLNTGLYLADRLYSESRLYNISGAYSEISTQMSQPVAAWGLIGDTFKALRLVEQQLSDPDNFDPIYHNTQYKGQNKYMVLAKRNIPILRVIQRYKNVARNNNYFRINDNNTNQRAVKNIGLSLYDFIHPYNNRVYGANKSGENVYY